MASVFLAALLASAASPVADARPTQALDLRCYRLMAELSEDDDPRIRSAGLTGAQYFLGRIDARQPRFDPAALGPAPAETGAAREQLVQRCGALMGAGGRDFRRAGEQLAREAGPAV
jgi:hypothetical protein